MPITILDVMSYYTGDFSIRTLVSVSRCSKLANETTKAQIDRKTRDTPEMRQLVLDIFPTIKNLPEYVRSGANYRFDESSACSYLRLLRAFFTETAARDIESVRCSIETLILDLRAAKSDIDDSLGGELKTSNGRKKILEAVQGLKQTDLPYFVSKRLQIIEDVARGDFSVNRKGEIDSSLSRLAI